MADFNDIIAAEKEMIQAEAELRDLIQPAAIAQQVVDFAKRRADSVLADFIVKHRPAVGSRADALDLAQADQQYRLAISKLMGKQPL